jgi:hypothetical protein
MLPASVQEACTVVDLETGMDHGPVSWSVGLVMRVDEDLAVDPFGLVVEELQFTVHAEDAHEKLSRQSDRSGLRQTQELLEEDVRVLFG